jgi:hypothetical protein
MVRNFQMTVTFNFGIKLGGLLFGQVVVAVEVMLPRERCLRSVLGDIGCSTSNMLRAIQLLLWLVPREVLVGRNSR